MEKPSKIDKEKYKIPRFDFESTTSPDQFLFEQLTQFPYPIKFTTNEATGIQTLDKLTFSNFNSFAYNLMKQGADYATELNSDKTKKLSAKDWMERIAKRQGADKFIVPYGKNKQDQEAIQAFVNCDNYYSFLFHHFLLDLTHRNDPLLASVWEIKHQFYNVGVWSDAVIKKDNNKNPIGVDWIFVMPSYYGKHFEQAKNAMINLLFPGNVQNHIIFSVSSSDLEYWTKMQDKVNTPLIIQRADKQVDHILKYLSEFKFWKNDVYYFVYLGYYNQPADQFEKFPNENLMLNIFINLLVNMAKLRYRHVLPELAEFEAVRLPSGQVDYQRVNDKKFNLLNINDVFPALLMSEIQPVDKPALHINDKTTDEYIAEGGEFAELNIKFDDDTMNMARCIQNVNEEECNKLREKRFETSDIVDDKGIFHVFMLDPEGNVVADANLTSQLGITGEGLTSESFMNSFDQKQYTPVDLLTILRNLGGEAMPNESMESVVSKIVALLQARE